MGQRNRVGQQDLRNGAGERLDHAWHSGGAEGAALWVIGHGVTANKDREFLVALAEGLANVGFDALRFSFAGNGDSEGRFEDATPEKEVEDLTAVLDAFPDRRIGYIGHSMGGAVGVLAAGRDERIRRLVSLAGMVHTAEFARRKFGDLEPGRDVMWEKPDCPLSPQFVESMDRIGSVDPARVQVPWLLVHGMADTVVPLQDSKDVLAAQPAAELVEIEGAGHLFGEEDATSAMVAAVVQWVRARG